MKRVDLGNIFGDDGFRSRFGEKYLTKYFLSTFAICLADYLNKKYKVTKCIIGLDTRSSGNKIYKIIARELIKRNVYIDFCGVIPSPGISYLLKNSNYNLGIMITASHNHFEDNGIKLFNDKGFKLSRIDEKKIEILIRNKIKVGKLDKDKIINTKYSKIKHHFINNYTNYLKSILSSSDNKTKIVIDCSNGASSTLINNLFIKDDNIKIINNKPNGKNINLNCGSLHPDLLQKYLKKMDYDFGISLDGDSDRCIFVEKNYGLIESEKVLFLFIKLLSNKYNKKIICSSEIVNKFLEFNLKKIKYSLFLSKVGDRNVINLSKRINALIGFEPSGHFYFPNFNNSMDGNLAMIFFINYIKTNDISYLKKILNFKSFNRIVENIPINNLKVSLSTIKSRIRKLKLHPYEKLLIRQSIWDPVYRVYYDYKKDNRFEKIKKAILK